MASRIKTAIPSKPQVAPKGLPVDPNQYWRSSPNPAALLPPTDVDQIPTLQRLGPVPFSGSGFPLMGFLATLFDHIAAYAREALDEGETTTDGGGP